MFFSENFIRKTTMPRSSQPELIPGKTYRTRELAAWGANPTRLAKRLLVQGRLSQLSQGLYFAPESSRFGSTPPNEREILRGFLGSSEFVLTGPPAWNALGLGTTAEFALTLVYNTKRSGEFLLGNLRFRLRRVRFPSNPPLEWFVIDLLEHHEMAATDLDQLEDALRRALAQGRFDRERLGKMANEYGTEATRRLVARCFEESRS
jgi:hypothetical protein